ncbi:MAG: cysteine methyltransferase [Ignavibacteriae bacterium HGW-Ignavibacteriae-3]|nr:MAG: cysteine methyltransferase [Ignavibacteriae bacterium HGW-Ignavibacteriae-3]
MPAIHNTILNSRIGLLEIRGTKDTVMSILFVDRETAGEKRSTPYLEYCADQLKQYFEGVRQEFDLNLITEGTEFQKKVWNSLLKIPYGSIETYLGQSKNLGHTSAVRAVAAANSRNKIPIIIPCHRVVGSDGKLTGYSGGLWRKKWLIQHERKICGFENQLELLP